MRRFAVPPRRSRSAAPWTSPALQSIMLATEWGSAMDLEWTIGANDGGVTRIRRDLHAHPELGYLEYRTAAKVASHLTRLGYGVKVGPDVMVAIDMLGAPTAAAVET